MYGNQIDSNTNIFKLFDKQRVVILLQETVDDMLRFVTFYLMFAVIVAQLVISAFVDKQPVGAVPLEDEVINRGHIQDFIVISCCNSQLGYQKKKF